MRVWLHRKTKECELKLRWFVPTVAIRFPNHLEEWCRMVLSFAMDTLPCKKGIVHDQTGCGSEGLCYIGTGSAHVRSVNASDVLHAYCLIYDDSRAPR
ncbi:unnamed protein product [Peronospora belbahrii]|uniref:Uncharacterized protein n=1 Tax=Peronospora belbahrii TaxID=622444 RepID=A0AAU9L6H3_9STRA|nr:unnamed protein product [Peronospora belbahrii]